MSGTGDGRGRSDREETGFCEEVDRQGSRYVKLEAREMEPRVYS